MKAYDYDRTPKRAYDYDRRKVADALSASGLQTLLEAFDKVRGYMGGKFAELKGKPNDSWTSAMAAQVVKSSFEACRQLATHKLFWGLVQKYQLSGQDQKTIEAAAAAFAKTSVQRPKRGKEMEGLAKKLDEYKKFSEAAHRVLREGKEHASEGSTTLLKAGPFTLVNTGNFSSKQMEEVQKIVLQAVSKVKASGQGKVCYGEIQVTNTIGRTANVLAFYEQGRDTFFVRGNLKGKSGPAVGTIIHELGHRLHLHLLSNKDDEIKAIYETLKTGEDKALSELEKDKSQWPKPGDEHKDGKFTYVVDRVGINRQYKMTVYFKVKGDPTRGGHLLLKNWFKGEGKASSFISSYAATSHVENFAEMFLHYCMGTLPDDQVRMLEAVL